MKRRILATAVAGVAVTGLVTACGGGDDGDGPVTLRFQSLAFQEASIAANKDIVKRWNEQNPDVQVEYVQGDWGSAHDELLTSFEGGDPPDVIHYESSAGQVFAEGGYLADLDGMLSDEFTSGINDAAWETVEYDEFGTVGVPFLVENRLPIANRTMLEKANIPVPIPGNPWTWDEFQDAAAKLTRPGTYGVAWPLDSPANAVVTLSQSFGGKYVDEGDDPSISVGESELEVPNRIHDMLHEQRSAAPDAVGQASTDTLPGFFGGKYAMVFGATWLRQQMVQEAPKNFDWVTLPPLEGSGGQAQAVNPQTLSAAAQSDHPEEAAEFIEFMLQDENLARLAEGDWLVPTSKGAREELEKRTGGKQGWDVAIDSADALAAAPWRRTPGFQEWMDRIATPNLQKYFADEISADELTDELESGSDLLSEER